jgi:hypothetical protein
MITSKALCFIIMRSRLEIQYPLVLALALSVMGGATSGRPAVANQATQRSQRPIAGAT